MWLFAEGRLDDLIDASFKVKERAYCPYSNFPVGAAALGKDGTIYTGALTFCHTHNLHAWQFYQANTLKPCVQSKIVY